MERFHDDIQEGHPGIARTMEKIQRSYYFPGMYRKLKKYITECDSCKRNKNDYQKPQGKMVVEEDLPTEPWKKLTADFVEMPATSDENGGEALDKLLVVVDTFSKQTILIPTRKTATTEEIFQLLWERIFSVFGIPETILSDRDKIFKTTKWQKLMNEIGSTQLLSTAYHQRTDGQTERINQEIEQYLQLFVNHCQSDWINWLPMAEFAYNNRVQASTKYLPFMLNAGQNPRMGHKP